MSISTVFPKKIPTLIPVFCKYQLKIMPKWLKLQLLDKALNHFFKESIEEGELDFLEGKIFKIIVGDLDYSTSISLNQNKIQVMSMTDYADVTLRSDFNPLILLISRKEDPDTLFFNRTLSIEGNTALVLEIKNWLDSLDFDLLPKPVQKLLQQYSQLI